MKQVRRTVSKWVQRLSSQPARSTTVTPAGKPVELDSRLLSQVSGGNGTTDTTPGKGW